MIWEYALSTFLARLVKKANFLTRLVKLNYNVNKNIDCV